MASESGTTGVLYSAVKVSSLKENCMLTLSRHTRGAEQAEMRTLKLPEMLLDKVIEYKMKDEQFYNKATETSKLQLKLL